MLVEKSFDTGEILMNYAEGAASGSPMVMLHGATLWWKELQPLIDQLESSWHIYAPDLRGHGKSGHASVDHYHVSDYARDVTTFMTSNVRDPAVVVGFSLGGLVALQVAAQLPQSVHALVLLNPPLELRELKVADRPYHGWFSWIYQTVKSSSSVSEVAAKSKVFNQGLDDNGAAGLAEMLYLLDPEAIAMLLNQTFLDGFDWAQVYHQINCLTLLLWGDRIESIEDPSAVRQEDVDFLRANVAQSVEFQIKGVGHGVHWGKTSEVLDHMTTFLNSIQST